MHGMKTLSRTKDWVCLFASDENVLRSEMSTWFSVDQDILVEYVYMKLKKPVQVGGFVKDFCPVAVVGQKDPFKDKQIKTFHQ